MIMMLLIPIIAKVALGGKNIILTLCEHSDRFAICYM